MKHYKGICEVGSLIGIVDDVRFQVDVRNINKFPMVKELSVKPWMYKIFST